MSNHVHFIVIPGNEASLSRAFNIPGLKQRSLSPLSLCLRPIKWMLDTDYDGRSLFPQQVFFPLSGEKEGWGKLAKNLKAEIDQELIEAYKGTVSLPFEVGEYKQCAVKIVDDRGIESLRIIKI